MNTVTESIYTIAGVCASALIIGLLLGTLVDVALEVVSAVRARRKDAAEVRFTAVDAGEIVDPDEPIPFTLTDEPGTDRQAVQR